MFGMNKQTMYVISNVGSTVVSNKAIEDSYVKPAIVFKTRGEAKLESAAKQVAIVIDMDSINKALNNDVIVAEVRIPVKKTFLQRLFA